MRRQNGAKRQYKRIQRETAARGIRRGLLLYYWGVLLRLWAAAMPDLYAAYAAASSVQCLGHRGDGAAFPAWIGVFFFFACFFFLLVIYYISYTYSYIYNYISIYVSIICVYIYLSIYLYICPPLLALAAAAAPHMNTRTSARRADHTTATPGAMQKNKGDSPSKKRV